MRQHKKEPNAFEMELDGRFKAVRKGHQREKEEPEGEQPRGGEYPQTRGAEGFLGEAPTRPVGLVSRRVRASTTWAAERPESFQG